MTRPVVWKVWPYQLGGAVVIPYGGTTYILVKRQAMLDDPGYQQLRDEELCHARQVERLGSRRYILAQLWARVTTMSVLAKTHPLEQECHPRYRKAKP